MTKLSGFRVLTSLPNRVVELTICQLFLELITLICTVLQSQAAKKWRMNAQKISMTDAQSKEMYYRTSIISRFDEVLLLILHLFLRPENCFPRVVEVLQFFKFVDRGKFFSEGSIGIAFFIFFPASKIPKMPVFQKRFSPSIFILSFSTKVFLKAYHMESNLSEVDFR